MDDVSSPPTSSRRAQRLADGVYSVMLDRLISNGIKPGARITVDGLSRELEVSQTPVREALTRLESDGLVVKVHLVGYRATTQLNEEQLENLIAIRLLLEPATAAKAATRRTEEMREEMVESAAKMARIASKFRQPTYGEFALEDAHLHDLIAVAGGNELLRESLTRLHSHLHLFRLNFDSTVTSASISEHQAVIDAIVNKDARAASGAMRAHLQNSRSRLRDALPSVPTKSV